MSWNVSGRSRQRLAAWVLGVAGCCAMTMACADVQAIAPRNAEVGSEAGATPIAPRLNHLDETPRIAVISAFAPELTLLRAALRDAHEYRINGVTFTTGVLQGHPVLLFLSGISMVNASMNTQLAFDRFTVSHVLFSGIAGGVSPKLHIGDVNVPEQWGQHLEVLMAREVSPGKYEYPADKENLDLPNFGMLFHRAVRVVSENHPTPHPQFWFKVDDHLLQIARQLQTITLQSCDAYKVCLREQPRLVVGGNGLSGSAFVDNAKYREHLYQTFQANVVDMESAACAAVAQANQIPFLAFRSVSDLAGGGPGANEMHVFLSIAAENSARVLMAFLKQWDGV